MASFKASNIETDDESDDEPDDTKEIQIEEALKVYQTAVKLQSQGRSFLKETGDAYKTLFESDVFSYPESWSEYRRVETHGEQLYDDGLWQYEQETRAAVPVVGVENAPSTLPQVLHLSYKNRALHYLDGVRASLASSETPQNVRAELSKALDDFTEALDKDEDDVDLWRRSAKISQVLKSHRISRYCLETVMEGDEQGTDDTLGDAGMEVKLADHDLDQITRDLEDDVWRKPTQSSDTGLPAFWRKQLSLYPYLPEFPETKTSYDTEVIEVQAERSWSAVGEAIYQRLIAEQEGSTNSKPEAPWKITVPGKHSLTEEPQTVSTTEELQSPQRTNDDNSIEPTSEMKTEGAEDQAADSLQQAASSSEQPEQKQSSMTVDLPTRKRSSDTAELPEEPEGGRIRSKRLRARESNAGEALQNDSSAGNTGPGFDEKIQASIDADERLSEVLGGIVERIGVAGFSHAKPYRDLVAPPTNAAPEQPTSDPTLPLSTAAKDFYNSMQTWATSKTRKLLQDGISKDTAADARSTGLSVFLEHSSSSRQRPTIENFDTELDPFLEKVNGSHMCTAEVALEWIRRLLCSDSEKHLGDSSYLRDMWPVSLKECFARIVISMDEMLSHRFRSLFDMINNSLATGAGVDEDVNLGSLNFLVIEVAQCLFEIHLDIFVSSTDSDATLDDSDRLLQRVRLNKWSGLSRDAINLQLDQRIWNAANLEVPQFERVKFRHLWTSVHQLKVLDEVEREHLVLCIEDLKRLLCLSPDLALELPNNGAMPELSIVAADGEISKLETMDFFVGIFQKEGKSTVDLIESLEPLLEESLLPRSDETVDANGLTQEQEDGEASGTNSVAKEETGSVETPRHSRSTFQILKKFLEGASAQLRLSLWHRLLEAYETIEYPSKVFSINLRCIQLIMQELNRQSYSEKTQEDREEILLDSLRDLRELLVRTLNLTVEGSNVFDCLDIDHLRVSIKAVVDLWTLLYAVGLYDDYSQAGGKGGSSVNPFRSYPSATFHTASVNLHDMQIQTSMLLYKLIREAMNQMSEDFPDTDEVRLDYLRHMHYQFGVRRICKAFDSSFLRFMRGELMSFPSLSQQSSTDLAQVLYDLYDLNCFSAPQLEREDHGCDSDYLDRKTAMQLIDFVMDKAKNVSVKDLLKSELGKTLEKLHTTLGIVKSNFAALRNRKFYNAYLKSPIQPLQLFRSLEGIADISAVPVSPEEGVIASKGWYLLKGQISLAKYRAQRAKASSGSEEDLNDAISFFMQDLEFDSERWETWYRMAQAHDGLLEEQILWSAEKMNNKPAELAQLQRSTIHTYLMATAVANRTAEPSQETALKLSELYTDFAVCIYSATRPPFVMRAFSLQDFPVRHFSNQDTGGGQYTNKLFTPLSRGNAWKFAIALLKRAAIYTPDKWVIHYMLGKCLWKLHSRSDRPAESRVAVQQALFKAIEVLPGRKDPNRQEPVLEPIYKLVSITHKLVQRRELDTEEGSKIMEDILQKQKQIDVSKRPRFAESSSWPSYVIDVLKLLRAADKPRWHHRLVIRAAQLIEDQPEENGGGAQAAKDYLVDQHIYSTKTYALTVWKPEHERPGRHWVYTQQYAQVLTRLLGETYDVEGIQLLAKRVRKKTNDYYEHTNLWEYVCAKHVAVHRRYGNVRHDCADAVFKHLDQEEFAKRADLLDKWIASPTNTHRLQEVLREAADLKKLNAALVKPTAIDDLLADTYAEIWVEFGPSLGLTLESAQVTLEPTSVTTTPAPPPPDVPESPPKDERRNIMSLNNLMNIDGTIDQRPSQAATPTPSQPDQATVRSRPRLISKREIIKRANDAVVNRPAPKVTTPPPRPALEPSDSSNIRVVIEQQTENTGSPVGSPIPSLHDSADDESELSEVEIDDEDEDDADGGDGGDGEDLEGGDDDEDDEDETSPIVVRPMFPNLHPRSPDDVSSQGEEASMAAEEPALSDQMDVE